MANPPKIHLPFLDGLRGVAILVVFLYHSLGPAFRMDKLPWDGWFRDFDVTWQFLALFPVTYGFSGVAIFFVISGFCIHLSHQSAIQQRRTKNQEPSTAKSWLDFTIRRIFRIYPPYLLAICVFFFLWPGRDITITSYAGFIQFATHAIGIHNFDSRTLYGINPSFWSIAVEIQLYFLYPLLLILVSKLRWTRAMILVGGIEVGIRTATAIGAWNPPVFISFSPFAYWFSWSLGAFLCQCFLESRRSRLFAIRADVLLLAVILCPLFKPSNAYTFLAISLLTATIIERLATGTWRLPQSPLTATIGTHLGKLGVVSFSFYLFHQPILWLTRPLFDWLDPTYTLPPLAKYGIVLLWYPLIYQLSRASYRWIELPSIAIGSRLRKKITS